MFEMPGDPYAEIAEFYDLEHDDLQDDVGFYLQYVASAGDPVLELACGTGRVALPIAMAGYRVVGIDVSDAMVSRARGHARGKVPKDMLRYARMDMRYADEVPGGPFGVVIMALDALSHLPTQEDQLMALNAAHRALDPRGVLLIDVMHASPSRLHALDGSIGFDGRWEQRNGKAVERFSAHSVHAATQTIKTRIWFDVTGPDGAMRRVSTRIDQRYVTPGELWLMLERVGFQEMLIHGGYELEPFHDGSERLIVAAEVTK